MSVLTAEYRPNDVNIKWTVEIYNQFVKEHMVNWELIKRSKDTEYWIFDEWRDEDINVDDYNDDNNRNKDIDDKDDNDDDTDDD